MALHSMDGASSRTVSEAEALFQASDYGAAFTALNDLDITLLAPSDLDRALPLLLMAGEATTGEEFALRLLDRIERRISETAASSIVKTYRAEATAQPHLRAALASSALANLMVSVAPIARHRALGVLLAAKVDLGQGLDKDLLTEMEELEHQITLVAPVDSALAQRGFLAYQVGLLDESRTALKLLRRQASVDGEHFMAQIFATHLATVDAYAGRHAAAKHLLESEQEGAPLSPAAARAAGLVALRSADEAALQTVLLQPTLQGSEVHGELTRRSLIGLAAARQERWREAYHQLSGAVVLAESLGLKEPGRRMWIDFSLARAAIAIGRSQEAVRIADRLESLSAASRPLLDGVVARIRALTGETTPQSIEMLEESVALLSGTGFPEQLQVSLLELGRSLVNAGRVDDARDVLNRAHVIAEQTEDIPAGIIIGRALDMASSDAFLAPLTSRERQVARAAARGASNRQIAEEGFTSVRTVETQLSSIYRKVGITSRTQLMALLSGQVREN